MLSCTPNGVEGSTVFKVDGVIFLVLPGLGFLGVDGVGIVLLIDRFVHAYIVGKDDPEGR